ncbi:MAG: hypothetical protein WCO84_03095 [bacterium]
MKKKDATQDYEPQRAIVANTVYTRLMENVLFRELVNLENPVRGEIKIAEFFGITLYNLAKEGETEIGSPREGKVSHSLAILTREAQELEMGRISRKSFLEKLKFHGIYPTS